MKKAILVAISAAALAPAVSFASDGRIDFNGEITAQTCVINNGNPNLVVNLPQVSTSALQTVGKPAGDTSFPIALTNCSPNSGNVRAYFEAGPTVDVNTGYLKLDSNGPGFATNVQIGLANLNGQDILVGRPNSTTNPWVSINNGSATLNYLARYVATGPVTAGIAKSSVMYSLEYQ